MCVCVCVFVCMWESKEEKMVAGVVYLKIVRERQSCNLIIRPVNWTYAFMQMV